MCTNRTWVPTCECFLVCMCCHQHVTLPVISWYWFGRVSGYSRSASHTAEIAFHRIPNSCHRVVFWHGETRPWVYIKHVQCSNNKGSANLFNIELQSNLYFTKRSPYLRRDNYILYAWLIQLASSEQLSTMTTFTTIITCISYWQPASVSFNHTTLNCQQTLGNACLPLCVFYNLHWRYIRHM